MARIKKNTEAEEVVFDNESNAAMAAAPSTSDVPSDGVTIAPGMIEALSEIQQEAELAKHAMAFVKSDNPENAEIPAAPIDTTLSADEQEQIKKQQELELVRRLKARAKRQGEIGLKQLTTAPWRRGDMELVRKVEVYDVPLSRMVTRFISIADRLIARLHGFGTFIMGEEKAATSIEILTGYIDELHRDAKTLHEQIKLTLQNHKQKREEAGEDWIEPQYARSALGIEVHLMRREGNKMLEAFLLYDKAIELLHVLEWNDGTDPDEINEIVKRASRMGGKIFRSALAGQVELGRRLGKRGRSENGPAQSGNASDTPQPTTEASHAEAPVAA